MTAATAAAIATTTATAIATATANTAIATATIAAATAAACAAAVGPFGGERGRVGARTGKTGTGRDSWNHVVVTAWPVGPFAVYGGCRGARVARGDDRGGLCGAAVRGKKV